MACAKDTPFTGLLSLLDASHLLVHVDSHVNTTCTKTGLSAKHLPHQLQRHLPHPHHHHYVHHDAPKSRAILYRVQQGGHLLVGVVPRTSSFG